MRSLLRPATAGVFALVLANAADAQQPYGNWVHDASSVERTLFVSQGGSDTNDGLTRSTPFATLQRAVAEADVLLGDASAGPIGVTINVVPASTPYVLDSTVSVPAYGVAIEPDRQVPTLTTRVTLQGSTSMTDVSLVAFDHVQGAASADAHPKAEGLPPSSIRGIDFVVEWHQGVTIDPTLAQEDFDVPIRVGVYQCSFTGDPPDVGVGVYVTKLYSNDALYANEIVDCDFTELLIGIVDSYEGPGSELIRGNRISACLFGILAGGDPEAQIWPRILSNAVFGNGSVNYTSAHTFGIYVGCSAHVIGNTLAYNQHSGDIDPNLPPAALYWAGTSAETLVVANNIFYHPEEQDEGLATLHEVYLDGTPGTLVIESNDYDQTGPLVAPSMTVSTTNIAIGDPIFVSTTDMHLTDASLSVVNLGDLSYTVPGTATVFTHGGVVFDTNTNLDFDLDARTHQAPTSSGPVLYRGCDQYIGDGIRLTTPASLFGVAATELADAWGNVTQSAGGTIARVRIFGPANSSWALYAGTTLPMGAELQHAVVTPYGSVAIDTSGSNGALVATGTIGAGGFSTQTVNFGTTIPGYAEGEVYLQAIVFRSPGLTTGSFTNRIRLDFSE